MPHRCLAALLAFLLVASPGLAQPDAGFAWPDGRQAALSLTFDDARPSQVDVGLDLFARHDARATFFVQATNVDLRLEGWKRAVAEGHEIGNHTLVHPCSGNFPWARERALESYSMEQMHDELVTANRLIEERLGVVPETFAYPCGQTYIGRGRDTRSTVPLVAGLFLAGRGWLDESPNDPQFCDLAQLMGMEMDGKDFTDLLPVLEAARDNGQWLVLAGHEIGAGGRQTTRTAMLDDLLAYVADPAHGFWLAPMGEVARYVEARRPVSP